MSDFLFKNFCKPPQHAKTIKNVWKKSDDFVLVDKSTDHDKPHFDYFVFYHNINAKKMIFFRARSEKGLAQHIDASSMVRTLIDNGKLANQIARLAAIVVKFGFNPSPPPRNSSLVHVSYFRAGMHIISGAAQCVVLMVNIYDLQFKFTQSRFDRVSSV